MIGDEVMPEDLPDKCQSLRLRSIKKRIETERNRNRPKMRKQREKPAPMSKYRRKTANARERQRMYDLNLAFEKLKTSIPHHKLNQIDEKNDTKITTLRCAISYINSLSSLLHDLRSGKSVSPEYFCTDEELGIPHGEEDVTSSRRAATTSKRKKVKKNKNNKKKNNDKLKSCKKQKNSSVYKSREAKKRSLSNLQVMTHISPQNVILSSGPRQRPKWINISLPQQPLSPDLLPMTPSAGSVASTTLSALSMTSSSYSVLPRQKCSSSSSEQEVPTCFKKSTNNSQCNHWSTSIRTIDELNDLTPLMGSDCFVTVQPQLEKDLIEAPIANDNNCIEEVNLASVQDLIASCLEVKAHEF